MSEALTPSIVAAPTSRKLRRRRVGRGRAVVLLGLCIAVFLLSPLALLAIDAHSAGWEEIHHVLFRARSYLLLRHTVILTLLVAAFAAMLGVATAWCTERTRLPARRVWTVLLVLPIAIPDDVVGYAWHTTFPHMSGLAAATLVMTSVHTRLSICLSLLRSALRSRDAGHGLQPRRGQVAHVRPSNPAAHPHGGDGWLCACRAHDDLRVRDV